MLEYTEIHLKITAEIAIILKNIFSLCKGTYKEQVLSFPLVKVLEHFFTLAQKHKTLCLSKSIIYSKSLVETIFEAMRVILENHNLSISQEKRLKRLSDKILSKIKESISFRSCNEYYREYHATHFLNEMCILFASFINIASQSEIDLQLNSKKIMQEVKWVVKEVYYQHCVVTVGSIHLIRAVIHG